MGEVIFLPRQTSESRPSLSLELRLEARKLDDYGELTPEELVQKAEYYLELEDSEDLADNQRKDVRSILGYVLSEMEIRSATGE